MYEDFYGLNEKPFSILPDPDFLYWSRSHELAFAMLEYGLLNHAGFTVITGDVGCGKTTLVRHLLNHLGDEVAVGLLTNLSGDGEDLLEWILLALGQPIEGRSPAVLYDQFRAFTIRQYAEGGRTLLILDEAQALSAAALEKLRMLSNINADKDQFVQLILVGQPQLKQLLHQPEMAQFAQRVSADFDLKPLALDELIAYIAHRLMVAGRGRRRCFTLDACRRIHAASRGIPRVVNILCDTALVYGYARNAYIIPAAIVDEVIGDKINHGIFDVTDGVGEVSIETGDRRRHAADRFAVSRKNPLGSSVGAAVRKYSYNAR